LPSLRAAKLAARGDQLGWVQESSDRPSSTAGAAARVGLPAPAVVGTRFALEAGRGRTAVPVRTTTAGVMLGIAALAMSLTFGSSLNYLLATPRLYGLTWDAHATTSGEDLPAPQVRALLESARS